MKTYYKATRPDGTDFYSGTIDYAAAVGGRVKAPGPVRDLYEVSASSVLHASDTPAETLVTGPGRWPCRLFEVTGRPVASEGHKFGFRSLRVVREVEAWRALGPNGQAVAALIDRASRLTPDEVERLSVVWLAAWGEALGAAWSAARYAARYAAGSAAWSAARGATGDAAGDAALALVARDLITPDQFNTLYGPWASVIEDGAA